MSEFGDSVYGLINFQLILIGNYIILILIHLYLLKGGTWESNSHFPLFKGHVLTVRGNLLIFSFHLFTYSAKHKLRKLIKPRQ